MKTEEKTQVSEVGFEPGTFRSCVAHSIHYATETPPIPDVLLVLVAPKHIHRNVTTTLQSRFTPTPTPQATTCQGQDFRLFYSGLLMMIDFGRFALAVRRWPFVYFIIIYFLFLFIFYFNLI